VVSIFSVCTTHKGQVVAYLHPEFVPPDILPQCKVSPWMFYISVEISSSNGNYGKKNDKVGTNTYLHKDSTLKQQPCLG